MNLGIQNKPFKAFIGSNFCIASPIVIFEISMNLTRSLANEKKIYRVAVKKRKPFHL